MSTLKPRPTSAFAKSSAPLTSSQLHFNEDYQLKQTLQNLIPDMPGLMKKNQSTSALLYSKFIMKGIKTNKIELVKDSFNRKKNINSQSRYEKKLTLSGVKHTNQSTRNSAQRDNLDTIKLDSCQNSVTRQQSRLYQEQENLGIEINNFFRGSTTKEHPTVPVANGNSTDRKMNKSQSENVLKRPKTATHAPVVNNRKVRAQTAKYQAGQPSQIRNSYSTTAEGEVFKATIPTRNICTIEPFESIGRGFNETKGKGFVNFIERNKRQLSAASSKKNSIYLTGVTDTNTKASITNEIKKVSAKRHHDKCKTHFQKMSMPELPCEEDDGLQLIDNRLSKEQIRSYEQKSQQNIEFMKKNMPNQYKKFMEYIVMKENDYTDEDRVLLSKSIDRGGNDFESISGMARNQDKIDNQTMKEAVKYYDEFLHLCENTEYHLKKKMDKRKQNKSNNQILSILACQQLIEISKELRHITELSQSDYLDKKSPLNERLYNIVKQLTFFKGKSQEQCLKLLLLNYEIKSVEEDQVVIQKNSHVEYVFVILSGSVAREVIFQQNTDYEQYGIQRQKLQVKNSHSYFDGDHFGEPENSLETTYRDKVTALEQTLLLRFSYEEYRKVISENQNIKDRIQLLRNIFGSVPNAAVLNDQQLESIAVVMERRQYSAKQIIYREGEVCDKLIVVGSGTISVGNERILKRKKKQNKDIKHRSKSVVKLNTENYPIKRLRRTNLKNYEIVKQNEKEFIFYYQDFTQELIKGDAFNWKEFIPLQGQTQQEPTVESSRIRVENARLSNSLISNSDTTVIYTLTQNDTRNLPEYIRAAIHLKVQDQNHKAQSKQAKKRKVSLKIQDPAKWDQYKQKLCEQIVSKKLKF